MYLSQFFCLWPKNGPCCLQIPQGARVPKGEEPLPCDTCVCTPAHVTTAAFPIGYFPSDLTVHQWCAELVGGARGGGRA